ncbi:MAG TPA: hypothetical protein VFB38_08610 [Chthonomonadaceae bacterium]|nr:hypothetical protein [Chthonomonadaceae bacterium]
MDTNEAYQQIMDCGNRELRQQLLAWQSEARQLLRPAEASESAPEQLLRPASGTEENDSDQLLRAAPGSAAQQPPDEAADGK